MVKDNLRTIGVAHQHAQLTWGTRMQNSKNSGIWGPIETSKDSKVCEDRQLFSVWISISEEELPEVLRGIASHPVKLSANSNERLIVNF
jgi:hypothetical protein